MERKSHVVRATKLPKSNSESQPNYLTTESKSATPNFSNEK